MSERVLGVVEPAALGLPVGVVGNANRYESSPPGELLGLVAALGVEPHAWGLVDLGCGRGQVLLEASTLGLREVVGVEASPALAAEARAAVGDRAVIVEADAAAYSPGPGWWILYAFNPFSASVLARVLANTLDARAPKDRTLLLYRFPQHARVVDRDPRWAPRGEVRGVAMWEAEPWG